MSGRVEPRLSRRDRRIAWALVLLFAAIFVGANVHLVYVAVASQPDCVPHSRGTEDGSGYRAAKSVC